MKSPRFFDRRSCGSAGQFYNVFYMTEQEYDVVVVGSGAAGMVAALTAAHQGLSTVVVEKAAHYGGSTARSGGGVWIPNNEILKRDGVKDTPEAAARVPARIVGDVVDAGDASTPTSSAARRCCRSCSKHSPLKLCWVPDYSDYYPEAPGGRAGGRSVEPQAVQRQEARRRRGRPRAAVRQGAAECGGDAAGLRPAQPAQAPPARRAAQPEGRRPHDVGQGHRQEPRRHGPGADRPAAHRPAARPGCPVLLNTALTDLYVEDGVVRGVYVRDTTGPESAEPQLIKARRGVILGSGGFEHNEQMRVKYQRAPITTEWTVGAAANTGDGIVAAEKLGAALDFMEDAWWGPTVPLVGAPWFALSERNSPGSIIVNMSGKRFMNESMPYVEACHWMYGGEYGQGPGPGENVPAWLIFDQQYRDRYIFAGLQPGQRIPKKWLESGVIVKADTLEELAELTACPRRSSRATVEPVQRLRPLGRRRGLPPRRERLRPVLRRPDQQAQPEPRRDQPRAVLRGQDGARRPRHQGRRAHRRARPGAARRRLDHRRPLRRGQRQLAGDGTHLSRPRRDHRTRDDVRLPGRAAPAPGRA